VATIGRAIRRLMAETPEAGDRYFGIGVAITGFFVGRGARVNPPEALEDLALIDLDAVLYEAFRLPVWIENDGAAAAIGESLLGVGRWAPSFAYLYFATGFGGGLIVDGAPVRGAHGNAGEFSSVLPPPLFERPTLELLRLLHGSVRLAKRSPYQSLGAAGVRTSPTAALPSRCGLKGRTFGRSGMGRGCVKTPGGSVGWRRGGRDPQARMAVISFPGPRSWSTRFRL